MNKYKYKARDIQGNLVNGEVEAMNDSTAAKLVRDRGYVLVDLKRSDSGPFSFVFRLKSRVPKSDVTVFTRQVATMINAGLPISEALSILRVQSQGPIRDVTTQILADVEGGDSLSVAMSKHDQVFPQTYVALVKAGETGGVLDKIMNRLADNLEKQEEFNGKVKGAMIYPVIIVIGMGIVSVVLMVFIMPKLIDLYSQFDVELPLPTKIMISLSNFFVQFWYFALAGIVGGTIAFRSYAKTKSGQLKIAQLIQKIPIIGELQKQIILTDLTRNLSLMVGSGVPILDGMTVTSGAIGNPITQNALDDGIKQIEKGFPISYAFAQHPEAFPYILAQMVSVGEETGKMEEVLLKVSHVFEVASEQKVKALTSAIEPVIMLVLGVGVAFLVVSVILPIYNLTTSI